MRGMRAYIEWFLVEKTEEWAKAAGSHQSVYKNSFNLRYLFHLILHLVFYSNPKLDIVFL
jgi:hypothetical protein